MNNLKPDNKKTDRAERKLSSESQGLKKVQKGLLGRTYPNVTIRENELPKQSFASQKLERVEQKSIRISIMKFGNETYRQRPMFTRFKIALLACLRPSIAKVTAVRKSPHFDADWYLRTYRDVSNSGMDPAWHYLEFGAREGRNPGPHFSTRNYQSKHPETSGGGQNPLLHDQMTRWRKAWRSNKLKSIDEITDADRIAINMHIASLSRTPLISIIMPAYNTSEKFLREAIASVEIQLYTNWELCIANDASPKLGVATLLDEFAARDKRIKVIHRTINGNISAATNSALKLAKGEFVALMDHDDLLHKTALYEVAVEINMHPEADVIYSDEDKVDESGLRYDPFHKSDFDPDLLLGQNMVSHLGVYRTSLINKIGGMRVGFEGSQDYDLILRSWAESSQNKIRHIPAILYHWRQGTNVKSFSESQLERCKLAAKTAVNEFLKTTGQNASSVENPIVQNYMKIERPLKDPGPLVSVVVPTKDMANHLLVCCNGVLEKTQYKNLELIIVDHESVEKKTLVLLDELRKNRRVRVLSHKGPFNYSKINNEAVLSAQGSVIAFLNNDVEIVSPLWLSEMVSHAIRPEIGAVGAKLLYPDGRIQHAGVIVGKGGIAGHAYQFMDNSQLGYFGQAALTRSVSAVTGACLVVKKSSFLEVGGFDEENFPVAFNDVDFCLKLQSKGYRNVWTPFAELIHHESLSRGTEDTTTKRARFKKECEYMKTRWGELIDNDPFYNPNLSLDLDNYEKVTPSRRKKTWSHFLK